MSESGRGYQLVHATTDGKRIRVRFEYNKRLVELVKEIQGRAFDGDTKEWRLPLTLDSCYALRRLFGDQLDVLPPLSRWAREELGRAAEVEAARHGQAAALDRVRTEAPDLFLAMKARPYQLTGTSFLVAAGQALLGDQPGLGKTLQTLAALIEADANVILVACPRTTARTVWERETARWAPHITTYVAQGNRAEREQVMTAFATSPGPKMLITNVEMMRVRKVEGGADEPWWPQLHKFTWDAVIVDESHQALASRKNVQSKGISQVRYGAMQIRRHVRPGGLALALSGTPFRSDLPKAWGTLNWLRPDVWTSFWGFAKTHFKVNSDGYGMVIDPKPLDPDRFAAALRPYFLARDKATAAPDLPPITYAGTPLGGGDENYVVLDMEPEQAKLYKQMERMASVVLDGGQLNATGVLAEITRLRQFALSSGRLDDDGEFIPALPSAKAEWVMEFLRERAGNDGKVVIASSFTRWINVLARLIANEFGEEAVLTLTGETGDAARLDLVKRFADPDSKVWIVVLNTKAGGVGITLDAADDMIITDLPWKSDDERQVIDRIHRVSRIHNVTVYRLVAAGTVDEWMAGLTDEQRRILLSADPEDRAKLAKEVVR